MTNKKAVDKANLELALSENNKKIKEYVDTAQEGMLYVNDAESKDVEVVEGIDADRLGGRLPSYYLNIDNCSEYVNAEADFLTANGHGKLRFYNGKFQYFDDNSKSWIDSAVSPENVYIIQMTPQNMKSFTAIYDVSSGYNKLRWEEPNDTIIDGQDACIVEKIVIRRKLGSAPTGVEDGDLVVEINRNQFGKYKNKWYVDKGATPIEGDVYYYKAFPCSTIGCYNTSSDEAVVTWLSHYTFGFRIDQTESDPASMITYIADNTNFESAYMNYSTGKFNYGDWTVDNGAWFMDVKPCMLKYDCTVAYYLNPDDYTKKLDGTASDIDNIDFKGNVMIEFPKVYYKCVNITDDIAEYYFCNKKLDDDYHCWSHIDINGNEIDYCYMPAYNGSLNDGVLRSLSSKTPIDTHTIQQEIDYALANNLTENTIWYTEVFADRQLVNLLLLLISKSTDSQTVFGGGYCTNTSTSSLTTGTMNTKGLFWGVNTTTNTTSGVKVFGIENYFANRSRAIAGLLNYNGKYKIKLTYGQSDGSTVDGYNVDGSGYIILNNYDVVVGSNGYISKMIFTEYGLLPISIYGSATTYYTDIVHLYNSDDNLTYAVVGGHVWAGTNDGIFYTDLQTISVTAWHISASISCKPLAQTN